MVDVSRKGGSSGIPHEDRTAAEPRQDDLHPVILHKIEDVNANIKLYKLRIKDAQKGVKCSPGQWLDVFVPGLSKAGGFTLTSTPKQANPKTADKKPYLELAVQRSPDNPPAAWLWRRQKDILDAELNVRVGGSFTWPPHEWPSARVKLIEKVIFVAGGVGINPLISMIASMFDGSSEPAPSKISFLYSTKLPDGTSDVPEHHGKERKKHLSQDSDILFLPRLRELADQHHQIDLTLFLTGHKLNTQLSNPESLGWYHDRRIEERDLVAALGPAAEDRKHTVVYVCGPPTMTDGLVEWFGQQEGMERERVLCEKWW